MPPSRSPWSELDDHTLVNSLPRGPGQRAQQPGLDSFGAGSLRFDAAFLAAAAAGSSQGGRGGGRGNAGDRGGRGGKGGKGDRGKQQEKSNGGQDMTQVFRCRICGVDSSGPAPFVQHCLGKAHISKCGGPGFFGIVKNAAGLMPPVSDDLIRACSAHPSLKGKKTKSLSALVAEAAAPPSPADAAKAAAKVKGTPAIVHVDLSDANHDNIRRALLRSASDNQLSAAAPPPPSPGPPQPRGLRKSQSMSVVNPPPPAPADESTRFVPARSAPAPEQQWHLLHPVTVWAGHPCTVWSPLET
jgi:hypothetical protein